MPRSVRCNDAGSQLTIGGTVKRAALGGRRVRSLSALAGLRALTYEKPIVLHPDP